MSHSSSGSIERDEEYRERLRLIRAEAYRLRHPTLATRIKRRVASLFLMHTWSWPTQLIRFLWRKTLGRLIYVKYRPWDTELEADAMRFVRAHTTIPVPRPYFSIRFREYSYLFMERIRGEDLARFGYSRLSDAQRSLILSQLQGFVDQLRALPPPTNSTCIGNVHGGPVFDVHLCCVGPYGPYADEAQMNVQLRHATLEQLQTYLDPDEYEIVRRADAVRHELRFTHGDIAPRNIMVQNGRLAAIIDWEGAGWFPEHWEYVKAFLTANRGTSWHNDIPLFLSDYKQEALADKVFAWRVNVDKYVFE